MEEKRLKRFTFYDLYYEALKGLPDEAAGKMTKNICRFMFTNEEIPWATVPTRRAVKFR